MRLKNINSRVLRSAAQALGRRRVAVPEAVTVEVKFKDGPSVTVPIAILEGVSAKKAREGVELDELALALPIESNKGDGKRFVAHGIVRTIDARTDVLAKMRELRIARRKRLGETATNFPTEEKLDVSSKFLSSLAMFPDASGTDRMVQHYVISCGRRLFTSMTYPLDGSPSDALSALETILEEPGSPAERRKSAVAIG
jgi:hypothetical protein